MNEVEFWVDFHRFQDNPTKENRFIMVTSYMKCGMTDLRLLEIQSEERSQRRAADRIYTSLLTSDRDPMKKNSIK